MIKESKICKNDIRVAFSIRSIAFEIIKSFRNLFNDMMIKSMVLCIAHYCWHYFRPVNETDNPDLPDVRQDLQRPTAVKPGRQRPSVVSVDHHDHPDFIPMPASNIEPKEHITITKQIFQQISFFFTLLMFFIRTDMIYIRFVTYCNLCYSNYLTMLFFLYNIMKEEWRVWRRD